MSMQIALEQLTSLSFADAVAHCRKALAEAGFGVLSEIDMQEKIKAKLGVDRTPYLILGACHPASAHKALEARPDIGVLLPCNVTISVEHGKTIVRAMDPAGVMEVLDHPDVQEVAADIGARLKVVLASLPE